MGTRRTWQSVLRGTGMPTSLTKSIHAGWLTWKIESTIGLTVA